MLGDPGGVPRGQSFLSRGDGPGGGGPGGPFSEQPSMEFSPLWLQKWIAQSNIQPMPNQNPTKDLYGAISWAYAHFNDRLFGSELPACLFVLQRQPRTMGYVSHRRWVNDTREFVDELAINPEYWLGQPLLEVLQTLVHEQCHVWQNHFGHPGRRSYHNREWANKMVSIGLMPSATGRPGGKQTGEHMNDYVLAGGAFQQAAEDLIDTGFGLPWLDRSAKPSERIVEIYDESGERDAQSLSSEMAAALAAPIGARLLNIQPNSQEEGGLDVSANEPILIEIAAKKPTRVKYRCNGCHSQVWGKPDLNLKCGDCDKAFVTVL